MEINNNLPTDPSGIEEEVSFAEVFFHYFNYWKWFVISIVICLLVAFIYLRYTTKEYNVSSKVLIKDEKKGQTGLDMNAFSDLGLAPQRSSFDNELEILLSKTLMKEVADSLKLGVSYFAEGKIKKREIYTNTPVFVSVSNQTETGSFFITQEADSSYSLISKSPDFTRKFNLNENINSPWGVLSFKENPFGVNFFPIEIVIHSPQYLPDVEIVPINKLSSAVTVSTITSIPQKGMDIINTLVAIYNRRTVDDKNYVNTNTIRFINERLRIISGELQSAEQNVENYQRSVGGIADPSAKAPIFMSESSDYNKRISDTEVQLSILRDIKNFLLLPENKTTGAPSNVGVTDPIVTTWIQRYNEVILEKNRNTVGIKANSPAVKDYDDQIALIKDNLIKGITSAESGMETTLRELKRKETEYESKTLGLASQERESRDLYRQKDIKESLFVYLLQKSEETGLSLALATPNAIVIDPADYSPDPVKPKSKIIWLAALLIGIMIPVAVIYIKDLFDNKLHTKDQLTKIVKAPFLGDVLQAKSVKAFPVLNVRSGIAEKFRIIASNLGFIVAGDKSKVIMVTSSYSGEGKSFFSQNLAMSLATSGKKTLLIDLDMRKSVFNKTLEITIDKGIAMFLSDPNIEISEIIAKGAYHKNLDIIPIKVFPPNPAELMASNRLDVLFHSLIGEYDYIIIDTAPVGLVADAFRINQFVDASIYVTRSDYTYKSALSEIQLLYNDHKLRNMTTILNGVSITKHYGYGYGQDSKKHNYYTEE
ncbi:tyrosine protein kinase [Bacteroidia bacterium]|nr:tyrosine protein kinase [Bacteroidia bacterium]GHT46497.1 tyrosine protein kinase [Bacteroidia bacterium]